MSKTSGKEAIILDASFYAMATMATQAITLLASILTRNFLGPVQMGIWSLLQVFIVFSGFSNLGASQAIIREIPFYIGKNDHAQAEEIKNVVVTFTMLTTFLYSLGVVLYAFLMRQTLPQEMFWGLLLVSIIIVLQRFSNLLIDFLRGYKLFTLAGRQIVLSAIVNAILVALLTWKFRIYGFVWAIILSLVFNIAYIYSQHFFVFRRELNFKRVKTLIQYGLPLIAVGLLSSTFASIDKLMIAKMIGLKELGLFSTAVLAYGYLNQFPTTFAIILIPNFHQKFGESGRVQDLIGYLRKSSNAFCDLIPLLIAAVWLLAPFFIYKVLPEFAESITAMRILVLSSFFMALAQPFGYFMTVIRKQLLLVPILGLACALAFVSNFIAIKYGAGIVGVGIASCVVSCVNFLITYSVAAHHLPDFKDPVQNAAVFFVKFIYMTVLLGALSWSKWFVDTSLWQSLVRYAIFFIFYLPFLIKLNRDLGVIQIVMKKLFYRSPTAPAVTQD